ncbi:MAG: thioredoxin-disulfide reductase [Planctomycetota bacterium]
MSETVVIIGSGPAGWTAAIYAARASLKPLVIEGAVTEENRLKGTLPLGQLNLTTEIENFPGFPAGHLRDYLGSALPEDRRPYWILDNGPQPAHGLTGPELMELMRQQAINFGARIITDDVVSVDFSKRPFTMNTIEHGAISAHAVIVATGARANWLGLPSEERFKNHGVSACAVCDGALPRFRGKPLAVVGGGDSAVEEASYLTKFASTVYLIHRRDKLRASKIMEKRALENPRIVPVWNSAVSEVLGNDTDGVTGIRLASTVGGEGKSLDIVGLFVAIGHTPNTDFLKGVLELDSKGYIVWPKAHRSDTTVEGIFAAGDVADSHYRQAVTAAGSGCRAALDAERWLAAQGVH